MGWVGQRVSVRKGALAPASPPSNGCRLVRSVRSVRSLSESGSGSRESRESRELIPACSVCMAPGPHGPLTLRCRVVSAPQQYGWGNRLLVSEPHPASFRYRDRPRPRSFYAIDLKNMDQGHWPYPPPWRGRKRHRVLCGRLSKSGWESRVVKAAAVSDALPTGRGPRSPVGEACIIVLRNSMAIRAFDDTSGSRKRLTGKECAQKEVGLEDGHEDHVPGNS